MKQCLRKTISTSRMLKRKKKILLFVSHLTHMKEDLLNPQRPIKGHLEKSVLKHINPLVTREPESALR
ncbi:hypothetical protein CHARACLAT_002340 [Characodon lateralis]|uniref:Uncharacterized protein n=1 Tax=Characodon lateralis TaxID=208331 RepID=A0ABU7EII9_9TELE|nr:hypothetical protein [Characodon lateralis]